MSALDKMSIVVIILLFQLAIAIPVIYNVQNFEDNKIVCEKWQCKEKKQKENKERVYNYSNIINNLFN